MEMNKQIKAFKMAISKMENHEDADWMFTPAINACKEALAEAEKQEPVGFTITGKLGHHCSFRSTTVKKGDKVYTHPATWQSLSDTELEAIIEKHKILWMAINFARDIEQALKEKNYGNKSNL